MIQKLLQNPLAVRVVLLTIFSTAILIMAVAIIRRIRRSIQAETEPAPLAQGKAGFSLAAYDGLARQIREQQKELQQMREKYQQETALTGSINESVLANLSCGVIFFDRMGMLRQANRAAKSLLGYASPFSFHMRDLFRGVIRIKATETSEEVQSSAPLFHALQETLISARPFPRTIVDYRSPGGQKRVLGLSAGAVRTRDGEILGLSCVIDDLSDVTELSQRVQRSENFASLGEISAGLVNDFKNSLATVLGYAQALLKEDSDAATRFYAEKVISELDSLARILDEFLEFAGTTKHSH